MSRLERQRIEIAGPTEADERGPVMPIDARRRRWMVGAGLAVVAVVVTVVIPLVAPDRASNGEQVPDAAPVEIGGPGIDGWTVMVPFGAHERAGFPAPVVRVGASICVGFARVDFGPDNVRPSLARCVPAASAPLEAGVIRLLASVKSGFDTWHFVETAADVTNARVDTVAGPVDASRVHLAGRVIGLRLENQVDLAGFSWSTAGGGSFDCETELAAWQTGRFCVDSQPA